MSTGAPTLLYTTRERLVTDWSQIPGDEQGRRGSIGIGVVSLQFHEGTARDVGGPEGTQPVRPLTARLWLSPSSGVISQLESALKRGSRASTDSETDTEFSADFDVARPGLFRSHLRDTCGRARNLGRGEGISGRLHRRRRGACHRKVRRRARGGYVELMIEKSRFPTIAATTRLEGRLRL